MAAPSPIVTPGHTPLRHPSPTVTIHTDAPTSPFAITTADDLSLGAPAQASRQARIQQQLQSQLRSLARTDASIIPTPLASQPLASQSLFPQDHPEDASPAPSLLGVGGSIGSIGAAVVASVNTVTVSTASSTSPGDLLAISDESHGTPIGSKTGSHPAITQGPCDGGGSGGGKGGGSGSGSGSGGTNTPPANPYPDFRLPAGKYYHADEEDNGQEITNVDVIDFLNEAKYHVTYDAPMDIAYLDYTGRLGSLFSGVSSLGPAHPRGLLTILRQDYTRRATDDLGDSTSAPDRIHDVLVRLHLLGTTYADFGSRPTMERLRHDDDFSAQLVLYALTCLVSGTVPGPYQIQVLCRTLHSTPAWDGHNFDHVGSARSPAISMASSGASPSASAPATGTPDIQQLITLMGQSLHLQQQAAAKPIPAPQVNFRTPAPAGPPTGPTDFGSTTNARPPFLDVPYDPTITFLTSDRDDTTIQSFNKTLLPRDVLTRFDTFHAKKAMTVALIKTPFSYEVEVAHATTAATVITITNLHFWHPMFHQGCILASGALLQPLVLEQLFIRLGPTLLSPSGPDVRIFYRELHRHAANHGIYVPPYELWTESDPTPIAFGNEDSHLPPHLSQRYTLWSRLVASFLQSKYHLHPDTLPHHLIVVRQDDGYKALRYLIAPTHPAFHACDILRSNYPTQQPGQDVLAYYDIFTDYVDIQRSFMGSNTSITVDVRVVAATHQPLEQMVREGKFREDLWYRICAFPISIPPLRERPEDILPLFAHFWQLYGSTDRPLRIDSQARKSLESYAFPGNVRELENEVRRCLVLSDGLILAEHLNLGGYEGKQAEESESRSGQLGDWLASLPQATSLRETLDTVEKRLVEETLRLFAGNQSRTAEHLKISRFGLQKMMKRLDIRVESAEITSGSRSR